MSFREWLLAPLLARLEELMKSLADLNTSIQANTDATNAVAAAFNANAGDFTAQVNAIDANTAKLKALVNPATPPPALSASPATVTLSRSVPQQVVTITGNGPFTAVSSAPTIATVTPASGAGPFTVEIAGPSVTGSANITVTDAASNTLNVPVSAG